MISGNRNVSNKKILRCINQANMLLQNPLFYKTIKNRSEDFDMANVDCDHIAKAIQRGTKNSKCEVFTYYKKWTRALAYYDPRYPNRVYINEAKLNRSDGSVVATIVHEFVHLVDGLDLSGYYGHGDNSSAGKQDTAPYWIDNIAESMIDNKKPNFNNTESRRIVTKKRWWQKLMFWR